MAESAPSNALENFDLKAEAAEARAEGVRFAFEFPRLLEEFRRADAIANRAKKQNRKLGYAAIALVLAALLIGSASPLLHQAHVSDALALSVGYAAAGLGLLGAVLAVFGMQATAPRRVWLEHRLHTEMLRLFHFHFLVSRAPDLVKVRSDESRRAAYLAQRDAAYDGLISGALADTKAELARIVEREGENDFRAVAETPLSGAEDRAVLAQLYAAWRTLRLNWQLGYVEAMLAPRATGAGKTPRQLEHMFSQIAWWCVGVIIALHAVMFAGGLLNDLAVWLEVAIVWTALIALAARALEEGLQAQRDVERYEQYRANILVTLERFEAADNAQSKLEIMRAFERTSLEEMRVFMRTHARSKFTL